MGWWSTNIMGGDPPYDAHAWVWTRALELGGHEDKDYDWVLEQDESGFDHDRDILRECLTHENVETMLKEIKAFTGVYHERDVHAQVLAAMIVESGSEDLYDSLKSELLEVILTDSWAKECEERAVYVLDLVRRVEKHEEGLIQELPTKGLMETMGEMLSGAEVRNPADEGLVLTAEEANNAQALLDEMQAGTKATA